MKRAAKLDQRVRFGKRPDGFHLSLEDVSRMSLIIEHGAPHTIASQRIRDFFTWACTPNRGRTSRFTVSVK